MSGTIWLSVFSTVLPNTIHHLVCIPPGAPHWCLGTDIRAAWLELAVSLVLANHHTSSSRGYCSQVTVQSILNLWANSARWAFVVCLYNTFSKTWTPLDPVFWNLSYIPAPFPKYCGNSLSDHVYSCTSSLTPLRHSVRIQGFHWLPQIQYWIRSFK